MPQPSELFNDFQPETGATPEQLATLMAVVPGPLPNSYLHFLQASDGGWGRSGERDFGLFGCDEVVRYWREYEFAEYMPGTVPFALNGGGTFYVFDLRQPLRHNECPVFTCYAGANTWDSAHLLADCFPADCFPAACRAA